MRASIYSLTPNMVILAGHLTSTGDAYDLTVDLKGAASCSNDSTGEYTLVLQDKYNELRGAAITPVSATTKYLVQVSAYDVTTSPASVSFSVSDAYGDALALADGDELLVTLHLRNSTVTE